MTKRILLLTAMSLIIGILIFNWACKKDDDIVEETELETVIVKQYEVVSLNFSSGELTSNEYNATLGDYALTLGKLNDTTLVISIPLAEPKTYSLEIDGLGTYKNNFEVVKTELSDTPENTLNTVSTGMTDYVVALPDTDTDKEQIQTYIDAFNNQINTATEEEKEKMALVYQANKELFDEILYNNYDNLQKSNVFSNLTKFKVSILTIGVCAVWASSPATVGIDKLVPITLGAIAFKKALDYHSAITWSSVKFLNVNLFSKKGTKNLLIFEDGVEKELSFQSENRVLSENDRNENLEYISLFFSVLDKFNEGIDLLNTAITYVNDNVPLVSFDLLPNAEFKTKDNEILNVTSDNFSNFSFSVASSHVSLQKSLTSEGKINLKMAVDENYTYTEPIQTQMIVSYKDGFNDIENIFNVTITPSDEMTLIEKAIQYGPWKSSCWDCSTENCGFEVISLSTTSMNWILRNCSDSIVFGSGFESIAILSDNKFAILKDSGVIDQTITITSVNETNISWNIDSPSPWYHYDN